MQSKLSNKRKKWICSETKQCCCEQFVKIIMNKLSRRKKRRPSKHCQTKATQTAAYDREPYQQIKFLIFSINALLENVLINLQVQKGVLTNKLQKELPCNEMEKLKKLFANKQHYYMWPEISRFCFGQPFWMKGHKQRYTYGLSVINHISAEKKNWFCSDITYFTFIKKPFHYLKPSVGFVGKGDELEIENEIDQSLSLDIEK